MLYSTVELATSLEVDPSATHAVVSDYLNNFKFFGEVFEEESVYWLNPQQVSLLLFSFEECHHTTSLRKKIHKEAYTHAQLTASAKNIFGEDLVDYAYLDKIEDSALGCGIDGIEYDAGTFAIVFQNGRTVYFETSEWALIYS